MIGLTRTAIQSQIQECTSIADRSVETVLDEVIKVTSSMKRVDCVNKDLTDLKSVLKRDVYYIEQLKAQVAKEMRHSNLISKYVDSSQSNQTFKILTNDQYSRLEFLMVVILTILPAI